MPHLAGTKAHTSAIRCGSRSGVTCLYIALGGRLEAVSRHGDLRALLGLLDVCWMGLGSGPMDSYSGMTDTVSAKKLVT